MIIKSTILPPARCTFPQNSHNTSEEFSGPKSVFFLNSFLTILPSFCAEVGQHISRSRNVFKYLQSTFIKDHIFCSWTLKASLYCPQPTQSNPQRKQSGNKSNGIESLGSSYLLSFLFLSFCFIAEKNAWPTKNGQECPDSQPWIRHYQSWRYSLLYLYGFHDGTYVPGEIFAFWGSSVVLVLVKPFKNLILFLCTAV